MAISTYADLQSAVATWLVRSDLTARIPDLIMLGEARLNRDLRTRRAEMDVALTGVPSSRFIPLPSAYTEALNVWITPPSATVREELLFVDPARITVTNTPTRPYAWTIDGTNLGFEVPCDQAYAFTLRCLEKYALSDAVPTNDLLTDSPDAYLYATLAEAGPLLRDPDVLSMYEQKLSRAIADINRKDARSRAQQRLPTEPGQLQRAGRRSGYNIYSDR